MTAFLLGILLLFQTPPDSSGAIQPDPVPVLHDSLITEDGVTLYLSEFDTWEFSPESPDSTTEWIPLNIPIDRAEALPDSLWDGYGWFRLVFEVDSSFALSESRLYIGSSRHMALRAYLNSETILEIGNPSDDEAKEVTISNHNAFGKSLSLQPGVRYVLTFERSYHSYNNFYATLTPFNVSKPQQFLPRLLANEAVQETISDDKINTALFGIISVAILIIILLHLALYYYIPEQKENFWIILVLLCIGTIAFNNFISNYPATSFWFILFTDLAVVAVQGFTFAFIPITTFKILKLEVPTIWSWYVLVGFLIPVIYYFDLEPLNTVFFIVIVISVLGSSYAIWKAYRVGKRHTLIPAISILGTPLALLIALLLIQLFSPDVISQQSFRIPLVLFLYLTLPVGLAIHQGRRFLGLHIQMDNLVEQRTEELNRSLNELKTAQDQLVQQEKLASLGQLTAGIAHEIKNPLNFVNNFSDLSIELTDEIREELLSEKAENEKGKGKRERIDEALEILNDIEANLTKIHEHGTRADSIVKSMLEHSRGGSGSREATDLNELLKEYVSLSFHGMRAGKDPINVDIKYDLDESVGEIPLIAEDFSRVIVNLSNNAFDAMRSKLNSDEPFPNSKGYKPVLTVRTRMNEGKVSIEIGDNGAGIPEDIIDKIMQPFFTTKKGTEGTGLGLSITNDIIKAHGGRLEALSRSGEGTTLKITLDHE